MSGPIHRRVGVLDIYKLIGKLERGYGARNPGIAEANHPPEGPIAWPSSTCLPPGGSGHARGGDRPRSSTRRPASLRNGAFMGRLRRTSLTYWVSDKLAFTTTSRPRKVRLNSSACRGLPATWRWPNQLQADREQLRTSSPG